MGRNVRVAHGESLDVELINHGLMPGNTGRSIGSPCESGVNHSVLRHSGGIVAPVKRQVLLLVPDPVSKMRIAPPDGPLNLLAVGIKQKFVMIETMTLLGSIRAVDAVSIQLAGTYFRQISVPYHVSMFGQRDAKILMFPVAVKQAKLHLLRVLGVQREVDALTVPG
jgi:hypothetical protein